MKNAIKDTHGNYVFNSAVSEQDILQLANNIVGRKFRKGVKLHSPQPAKELFLNKLAKLEHEVFAVLFIDNSHRVIEYSEMFRGTINAAMIYPREIVKRALRVNAAAVILAHNHPSGNCKPSSSDIDMTKKIADALTLVDIRVLDHIIIGDGTLSFAETGFL